MVKSARHIVSCGKFLLSFLCCCRIIALFSLNTALLLFIADGWLQLLCNIEASELHLLLLFLSYAPLGEKCFSGAPYHELLFSKSHLIIKHFG